MPGIVVQLNTNKSPLNQEKSLALIRNAYIVKSLKYNENYISTNNSLFYSLYPSFITENRIDSFFDNRFIVLIDGDYYNYRELKVKYNLENSSKLSLLVELFKIIGDNFAEEINGEFTIVIYDKVEDSLIITNDRYARKAFYWLKTNNAIFLATEKKGILSVLNERVSINDLGLLELFLFRHNLNEKTFLKNISKLNPASYLVYKNNEFKSEKYFTWNFNYKEIGFNRKERIFEINEVLSDALKIRFASKDKILLWLSAGYDSRALACFLPENLREKVKTETFGDKDSDEVNIALEIAKKLGYKWKHREVTGSYLEIAAMGSWRSEFAVPSLDHPFIKPQMSMKKIADYIIQGVPGLNEINSGHLRIGKIIASMKPNTYENFFNLYGRNKVDFSILFKTDYLNEYYTKAKNEFIDFFNNDLHESDLYKWDSFNLGQRQPNYSHMADLVENDLFETIHPFTDTRLIPLFTQIPFMQKLFLQISKDLLYQSCKDIRNIPFGNGRGILKENNTILNSFWGELKSILIPNTKSIIWDKRNALERDYEETKNFILLNIITNKSQLEMFSYGKLEKFCNNKELFLNNYKVVDILVSFLFAYNYFLTKKEITVPKIIEENYYNS